MKAKQTILARALAITTKYVPAYKEASVKNYSKQVNETSNEKKTVPEKSKETNDIEKEHDFNSF